MLFTVGPWARADKQVRNTTFSVFRGLCHRRYALSESAAPDEECTFQLQKCRCSEEGFPRSASVLSELKHRWHPATACSILGSFHFQTVSVYLWHTNQPDRASTVKSQHFKINCGCLRVIWTVSTLLWEESIYRTLKVMGHIWTEVA